MAFSLQNLARSSVSAQEPIVNIPPTGTLVSKLGCFNTWNYYGVNITAGVVDGDSFGTMLAANYFNDAAGQFQVGDVIYAYSASQLAYMTFQVTTVTSTTVSVFPLASTQGFDGTLSNAILIGMFAAPSLVLAAPGAGYAWLVNRWSLTKIAGALAYTGGGAINLYYDNTRTTAAATAIPATVLTTSAAAGIGSAGPLAAFGVASALYVNQPLYISNITGAFATNVDSTAILYIDAELVSL